ncbi:T9SS type A sorting domain-containing protein [Arundinibacter roseus]|uniref:T9SS type A sorting domain-containing protein n=1 Tax=Arundinibacter roseus TaxID=2070510 RepID=A0A4R4KBT7_9BACT|nr:T9SS type A sorting domain-containing protein [Arundinibacter roseus]
MMHQSALAQLEVVPLGKTTPRVQATSDVRSSRIQALSLPFFDDFSTSATQPDPLLWMPGSGVYINNTLTTGHPSINVATFDGLNAAGIPYNFVNELAEGDTDTLTSAPINLGGLTAADSIYLSFYWQAQGLGERPDDLDTLRLEFLTANGSWESVWQRPGGDIDSAFQQSFIPVLATKYLHAAFQFRFRSFGRLSGAFDTWHLDYIYLDKNRTLADPFIKDIAVRKPLTPLLKGYTSMPFKQYYADPAAATADSVRTDIVNLFNNFNFTSYTFTITDEVSQREIQRFQEPVSSFIAAKQTQTKSIGIAPFTKPTDGQTRMRLRYTFDLLTTDDQNPTIPSVNLRRNDTISAVAELADYYAYDDGSAEFGIRMNQRLGRTAVRFVLQQPDTLGGVRMAMVPFRKDIGGQGFTIQVWSNRDGRPDRVVYQKSVPVRYGTVRNEFIDYPFDFGVAVSDTFYIGWLQISEDALSVGFDRNSISGSSQIFSNLSQDWAQNTEIQGSIMLRPYFGGKTSGVITGPVFTPEFRLQVFPNPTSGVIQWNNELTQIDIFDIKGTRVKTILPQNGQKEADLSELSEGMYVFRLSDGLRWFTQKIVLKK